MERATRTRTQQESVGEGAKTREEILAVALEEFAFKGLNGARVDEIAEKTRTSKRMIYYHFGSKEGLYEAVLERAYQEVRSLELELQLEKVPPGLAIQRLVEQTFDYDETHPMFVRLISIENIHRAEHLKKSPQIRSINEAATRTLESILQRGRKEGVFRTDVTPLDVHMLISALCYFRVSNRYTFGAIFNKDLSEPRMRNRHKKLIVDAVVRFLQPTSKK